MKENNFPNIHRACKKKTIAFSFLNKKNVSLAVFIFLLYSCSKDLYEDNINNPSNIFNSFWEEVDRNYSFFTYLDLDWDSIYYTNLEKININTSDSVLYNTFCGMLNCFNDAHLNIYSSFGTGGNISYFSQFQSNQIDDIESYFSIYSSVNKCLQYGFIENTNLGYIRIKTFEGETSLFEKMDSVVDLLKNTKGIIIDIRGNKGGLISNANLCMQNFVDSTTSAFQYRYRDGKEHEDFSKWEDYRLKQSNKTYYSNNIAILTNRMTYSASEWFVAMSKALPNFTTIGDTTGGGSGIPLLRELPNGWILRISNSQLKLPDGNDFQFTGLYPDIPLWITTEESNNNIDEILERAISLLNY